LLRFARNDILGHCEEPLGDEAIWRRGFGGGVTQRRRRVSTRAGAQSDKMRNDHEGLAGESASEEEVKAAFAVFRRA